ncbi:MAG TPA: RebB family R body protein [Acetobacteraceae bacterium]|nr:RebB family R body protein [Acetobacteraceae bacterium]
MPDPDISSDHDEGFMAYTTELNGQITDAVAQVNVEVSGDAPAQAMATTYQTTAQAVSLAMQNAVAGQQTLAALSQAILRSCVQALGAPTLRKSA